MNSTQQRSFLSRFWEYQQERFPLLKLVIMVGSFSFCAVCLSALLGGRFSWPDAQAGVTAFVVLLLFFLQMRIADEFKDNEEDTKYRPERPVPRGLVSLEELKKLGVLTAVIQLILSLLLYPPVALLLLLVWVYMSFMTAEFFVSAWLKRHSFVYLWSHMLVMPLIDLFATGCVWLAVDVYPPEGLIWFLIVSFFNGVVVEIGRKTWAPDQEREGVDSYSSDWGIAPSIFTWITAIVLSLVCACIVAIKIKFLLPVLVTLSVIAATLILLGVSFLRQPTATKSKYLENASGLWVASLYLILGVIPMGYHVWLS